MSSELRPTDSPSDSSGGYTGQLSYVAEVTAGGIGRSLIVTYAIAMYQDGRLIDTRISGSTNTELPLR